MPVGPEKGLPGCIIPPCELLNHYPYFLYLVVNGVKPPVYGGSRES
jgi:hypothetical protein